LVGPEVWPFFEVALAIRVDLGELFAICRALSGIRP